MSTRGRHPAEVLSLLTRRKTRKESRSKSPQRRREATFAENLNYMCHICTVQPQCQKELWTTVVRDQDWEKNNSKKLNFWETIFLNRKFFTMLKKRILENILIC
jgi:hypothetical protein